MILNLVDCVESLFSLRRQKRLREGGRQNILLTYSRSYKKTIHKNQSFILKSIKYLIVKDIYTYSAMEKIGKNFCLNCAERKQALSIILNSPLHLSVTLRIFIANLWEKIPFVQHKIINNSND